VKSNKSVNASKSTDRVDLPARVPDFNRHVYSVLGLPVDAVTLDDAVARLSQAVNTRHALILGTPNLNNVILSRNDSEYRDSFVFADLSIADGMPLVLASRLMGIPICQRVAGASLFQRLVDGAAGALSIFFFGGPDGIAAKAAERLNRKQGKVRCAGFLSPGFGSVLTMSGDEIIDTINHSRADMLVLALGSKKGQAWIYRNAQRITAPIVCHLGAVINFQAGSVLRAPEMLQQLGLEWLWRIKEEPSLWRRYFFDFLAFIRYFLRPAMLCAWHRRFSAPSPEDCTRARLEISIHHQTHFLRFQGGWCESNLESVRAAFTRATSQKADFVLDLGELSYGDAAFIGLLMIAYGHQLRSNRGFRILPLGSSVVKIFRRHSAEFLLDANSSGTRRRITGQES